MAARRPSPKEAVARLVVVLGGTVALTLLAHYSVETILPWLRKRSNLRAKSRVLKRLGHRLDAASLTLHESLVASQVVDSEEISDGFDSIGGHGALIKEICAVTTLPLSRPELRSRSALISPARGVLLYGPPGTGKTMIARALAKESGLTFLNLDFGQVLSKYVGESEKLISAVFSLAAKLAPSMIFIDEIDCYMRQRSSSDHEFTAQMKAQFMSCWDGFDKSSNVIVIAASNRPDVIDPAILRRLPCKFGVDLPTTEQRADILAKILRAEQVDADVDLRQLARRTEGFSGDDLRQLCHMAAMSTISMAAEATTIRSITMRDLLVAHTRIMPASSQLEALE